MEQNKQNSALLVMDMQSSILSRLPEITSLLANVKSAIAHARTKKIPVIYVVVGFRQGAPEISQNNKGFMTSRNLLSSGNMEDMIKVHPELSPLAGDITVVKRRISAFTGSDLEVVLRAFDIQHLILTGIATGGVVLSTLREAADKDYILTVLKDGCADGDEEVHRVLTTKVFPRQADVISVDEWTKTF
jgi:nicotinamidase-related amidase